jgi:hypothetical protein
LRHRKVTISSLHDSQATACIRATAAKFRALPAMFHALGMLSTFFGALITNNGASSTESDQVVSTSHQQFRCRQACGSTFHIEPDTGRQHFQVLLFQTFYRTALTGRGTGITNINTVLKSIVSHFQSNFAKF